MPHSRLIWTSFIALALIGCRRDDQIQTYRIPKEQAPSMPLMSPGSKDETGAAASRGISWTVPEGWRVQAPSSMRVGSFLIQREHGQTADVSVIPLAGEAGGDLPNINRWRGQISLAPISETDLPQQSETIAPAGRSMRLIDFANQNKRLVAATYHRNGGTWFFKMTGDEAAVTAAKPAFLRFLKSLRFADKAPIE